MGEKNKRVRVSKPAVTTEHFIKRIAELQRDLDAAKLRIDALEAARLDYSPPQTGTRLWRRFWS